MNASQKLSVMICPGIHSSSLTESFLQAIAPLPYREGQERFHYFIFPTQEYPAFSGFHVRQFLQQQGVERSCSLLFIGFSAGVVGAIAAAQSWQYQGGTVRALIAVDGWGVPLVADFPIYRLSHDFFTHWSSALLGSGLESFYADPAIDHLDLWRSPQAAQGWKISKIPSGQEVRSRTTAANFMTELLYRYQPLTSEAPPTRS